MPGCGVYIFPGGYTPALSELAPAVERSGLIISDIEVLRIHYAETLRAWRINFLANRAKSSDCSRRRRTLQARFGTADRFIRMWEFYLAGFEASFRYYGLVVFQVQLIKDIDAVPLRGITYTVQDVIRDLGRSSPKRPSRSPPHFPARQHLRLLVWRNSDFGKNDPIVAISGGARVVALPGLCFNRLRWVPGTSSFARSVRNRPAPSGAKAEVDAVGGGRWIGCFGRSSRKLIRTGNLGSLPQADRRLAAGTAPAGRRDPLSLTRAAERAVLSIPR
jgi:hypothetical protein